MAGPAPRRVQAVLLCGAAAALAAAAQAAELGWSLGSRSPLLWGAAGLAGVAAVALLWLAAVRAPQTAQWYDRVRCRWELESTRPEPPALAQAGRRLTAIALVAAACNLTLSLRIADDPADDDQGAYLGTAAAIAAQGAGGFGKSLWTGAFAEANRHPLYLAALALHPSETFGRGLACLCGALAWGLAVYAAQRRCGWLAAGLFAAVCAVNASWLFHSTRVYCESLLMLTSLAAWLALIPLTSVPRTSGDSTTPAGYATRPSLVAGGWLGLAWLTKATGLLLWAGAIVAVCMGIVRQRTRSSAARVLYHCACLSVAFLVVGSPLLVRNLRRFGNPFYNVNSQLLFVDAYSDPEELAAVRSTGVAAREYWRTHSLADLLRREGAGLVWETYILVRSLGPAPLDDARVLVGLPVVGLCLIGLISTAGLPARLTLTWTLLLWVVFAWYTPIAAGERFLAPVLLPLLLTASAGGAQVLRGWLGDSPAAARGLIVAGLVWCAGWTIAIAAAW